MTKKQNKKQRILSVVGDVSSNMIRFSIQKCFKYGIFLGTLTLLWYGLSIILSTDDDSAPEYHGFLVNSSQCKIPRFDTFDKRMMKFISKKKYTACHMETLSAVHYNEKSKKNYLEMVERNDLNCVYKSVHKCRKLDADDSCIEHGEAVEINKNPTELPSDIDFLFVECSRRSKIVYKNIHALFPDKTSVKDKQGIWKGAEQPYNIIIFGIDTMSRMNFYRTMPETAKYVEQSANKWYTLEGYNKAGLNTFPNMLAFLAGLSEEDSITKYDAFSSYLDDLPWIWKEFQNAGYVTAHAEDFVQTETFHYLKKGFMNYPTDFYLWPYMNTVRKQFGSFLSSCLGGKNEAEHIYDFAVDFIRRFKNQPHFGFFWANSFSHESIYDATAMDKRIKEYLRTFEATDQLLNNTIFIFGSDHGVRWGKPRNVREIGFHEDSMPFMFVRFPEVFKAKYPHFIKAFQSNNNKLTSPFDMYLTLKHILRLSLGSTKKPLTENTSCKNCHSLLSNIPLERSCSDAGIPEQFCTCQLERKQPSSQKNLLIADKVIAHINNFTSTYKNGQFKNLCQGLSLASVLYNYQLINTDNNIDKITYRISLTTYGNMAEFEGTVTEVGNTYKVISVFRVDSYKRDSACIQELALMQFCSCHKGLWG